MHSPTEWLHRRLHAVATHRPGIVYGLEVVASKGNKNRITVWPGVAIDSDGQTIVVKNPVPSTLRPRRIRTSIGETIGVDSKNPCLADFEC